MNSNFKYKISNSRKGFTLIELMVVIAIVGILSSIAIVNSGKNPDRDVKLEKDRLVAFLREVQNKALSAEQVSAASGKVCGFGVTFSDTKSAKIFYLETIGANKLNADCSSASKKYSSDAVANANLFPSAVNPEQFLLNSGVVFNKKPNDIYFQIPDASVFINGSSSSSSLTLQKTDGAMSASQNILVSSAGIIQ